MTRDYIPGRECRRCGITLTRENTHRGKAGICASCDNDIGSERYHSKMKDVFSYDNADKIYKFEKHLRKIADKDEFVEWGTEKYKDKLFNDMDRIEKRDRFVPLNPIPKKVFKSCSSKLFLDPDETRVALLDIETTGLKPDFSVCLCGVTKTYGTRERHNIFAIDQDEPDLLVAERDMLECLNENLEGYDGLITFYGNRFDIPFLRTRSFWHGLKPLPKTKSLDMYFTIRKTVNPSSRRMDRINQILKVSKPDAISKTPLGILEWNKVLLSRDQQALDYIITHCKADIDVLEEITNTFSDFVPDRILRY